MNGSLLRGRLQVRILPGSPKIPEKYGLFARGSVRVCRNARLASCEILVKSLYEFRTSVRLLGQFNELAGGACMC